MFGEFERAMIRERVKSGLERAKAQGKVAAGLGTETYARRPNPRPSNVALQRS